MSSQFPKKNRVKIPLSIKQAQIEFPQLNDIKIKLGTSFIEYKLILSELYIRLLILFSIFFGVIIFDSINDDFFSFLIFLILLIIPIIIGFKVHYSNHRIFAVDLALKMLYASDKDIPFDEIQYFQIVKIFSNPVFPQPNPFTYGLKLICKQPQQNTIIFRIYTLDSERWFMFGTYLSTQLTRLLGRNIPFIATFANEKTNEMCLHPPRRKKFYYIFSWHY
jgi:hypothetical protein